MPIKSYKLTAGKLLLGTAPLDVSAQVTACAVRASEEVSSTDPTPVLSGEELAGDEDVTYGYTLEATLLQDLEVSGVIEWSWNHKGEWLSFIFIPNVPTDRGVKGEIRPIPIDIGGEVKTRPTSDITWAARGSATDPDPTFGIYDNIGNDVDEDV